MVLSGIMLLASVPRGLGAWLLLATFAVAACGSDEIAPAASSAAGDASQAGSDGATSAAGGAGGASAGGAGGASGVCDPGFADCDGDPSNGCEHNVLADGPCACAPGDVQGCYAGAQIGRAHV